MREILFRGKRTDNGEWAEGYYVRITDGKVVVHRIYAGCAESDCGDFYPDWYEVVPETVGQFTGLTDKSGTKIFEGDVVKNSTGAFTVVWDNDFSSWSVTNKKGVACYNLNTILSDKKRTCEIIGNIYDNSELMEVEENDL